MGKSIVSPGQRAKAKAKTATMTPPPKARAYIFIPPGIEGMSKSRRQLPLPGTFEFEQALIKLEGTLGRPLTKTERRFLHKKVARLHVGKTRAVNRERAIFEAKLGPIETIDWAWKD